MDNAQKAIMIGVGLFITIIIISAVLLVVNLGTGMVDDATEELGSMSATLQNQLLQSYDGTVISGAKVRAALQQYQDDSRISIGVYDSSSKKFVVQTGAYAMTISSGTVGNTDLVGTIGSTKLATKTTAAAWNDSTNTAYVNTSKEYKSSVLKNANGTILGIVFEVKK